MARVTGGSHPAVAWQQYMEAAHVNLEPLEFPVAGEIVTSTAPRPEAVADDDGVTGGEAGPPPLPIVDPTTVGDGESRGRLLDNCSGSACVRVAVPGVPRLPPPESPPPAATPPATAAPPSPADTDPPNTGPPNTGPPTTAPPLTDSAATSSTTDPAPAPSSE